MSDNLSNDELYALLKMQPQRDCGCLSDIERALIELVELRTDVSKIRAELAAAQELATDAIAMPIRLIPNREVSE